MKLLFRSAASAFVLLGTLLLDGHARDEQAHPATTEPVTVRELTAEEGRKALLALTEHDLAWLAKDLRTEPIHAEGRQIYIGRWNFDLSTRRFTVGQSFP